MVKPVEFEGVHFLPDRMHERMLAEIARLKTATPAAESVAREIACLAIVHALGWIPASDRQRIEDETTHDGAPLVQQALDADVAAVRALKTFWWKNNYRQFCALMGWDADSYAEEKWVALAEAVRLLDGFDDDSLAKIVRAGVAQEGVG